MELFGEQREDAVFGRVGTASGGVPSEICAMEFDRSPPQSIRVMPALISHRILANV